MKKETPPSIDFKPLSAGLGFHPFSDGLPYAPIAPGAKQPQAVPAEGGGPSFGPNAASGATAAGPARLAPTLPAFKAPLRPRATPVPSPRVQVPVVAPISPATPGRYSPMVSVAGTRLTHPSLQPQPAPRLGIEPQYGILYMLKRVIAYSIDTTLNIALSGGALSLALWNQNLSPDLLLSPATLLVSVTFFAIFNWALVTAQEIIFGTSFGKRLFRLALQGSTAAIFLRAFFFLPSLGFGGIGLLWAIFDRRRRCWHDLVVDVQPLEIAKL